MKKKIAVLKRAMTEKRGRWQIKEWHAKTKSRWQQPAGEEGRQSSHNTVEKYNASKQVERNLYSDRRNGDHCDRKDKHVEQKL